MRLWLRRRGERVAAVRTGPPMKPWSVTYEVVVGNQVLARFGAFERTNEVCYGEARSSSLLMSGPNRGAPLQRLTPRPVATPRAAERWRCEQGHRYQPPPSTISCPASRPLDWWPVDFANGFNLASRPGPNDD